jgi:hypothetical protein
LCVVVAAAGGGAEILPPYNAFGIHCLVSLSGTASGRGTFIQVVKKLNVGLLRYSNVSLLEMGSAVDPSGRLWIKTTWGWICTKTQGNSSDSSRTALQLQAVGLSMGGASSSSAWGGVDDSDGDAGYGSDGGQDSASAASEAALPREHARESAMLLHFYETSEDRHSLLLEEEVR